MIWEYLGGSPEAGARLQEAFTTSLGQTAFMLFWAMLLGEILGLVMGVGLYVTRSGNILGNRLVFTVLNVLVNIVRPIPFIIFLSVIYPVTKAVVGSTIGTSAMVVPMVLMAGFAFSRLVEQNLVALDPGVIEAARAMGASPLRIITTVIVPEALAPLILAYTFLFIGVLDMSAMAGYVGGGGIGDFAIVQGYRQMNWPLTLFVVVIIILIVQVVQFLGNSLARRMLRR